jgi:agmatinase
MRNDETRELIRERIAQANHHRLALIGFPYDASSSFMKGAAEAPPRIRAAFRSEASNLWSESGVDLGAEGVLHDLGDVSFQARDDVVEKIDAAVSEVLDASLLPLCLGGDHSVTYPIVRALSRHYAKLGILHLDAHPDLYDVWRGDRFSHACPFARVMEEGLVDRLVQVGIRDTNGHQREQAKRFGIEVVEMRDWRGGTTFSFNGPVYISFDLDVLDPAFAPGVSHHEPGGFSTRQVLDMIHALEGEVVGADIVELNPRRDPAKITEMAAAKILKEIAARMLNR